MQEIASSLVVTNREFLELDFQGIWKFGSLWSFFCPGLSLLCSLVLFFHCFFSIFTLLFSFSPLLPSSLLSFHYLSFSLIFWMSVQENLFTLQMFILTKFQRVTGTANGWSWLQVCASISLALCTEMSNSLTNAHNLFWWSYVQWDLPWNTGNVEHVTLNLNNHECISHKLIHCCSWQAYVLRRVLLGNLESSQTVLLWV